MAKDGLSSLLGLVSLACGWPDGQTGAREVHSHHKLTASCLPAHASPSALNSRDQQARLVGCSCALLRQKSPGQEWAAPVSPECAPETICMSGDSVDTLEVHTEPFEMEGGEEEEQRPAVNGVVFSKVKAVERHRVRGSVPRDGPALQQPGTPNTDALSWRVRKRSPQFIRAECTDSVIIQADPPTPEERRSEVQREITKRAERQRRHTNGSICPPAIIRVCLPGRFKSSRSAKNSQPWDSAKVRYSRLAVFFGDLCLSASRG